MVITPGFERAELIMDPSGLSKPGSASRRTVKG
jgi:hypothetical protein